MDPMIKRRLVMDVVVYPCTGLVDGDKTFGTPITLKSYIAPKYGVVLDRDGHQLTVNTAIYVDGIDFSKLSVNDEVSMSYTGRVPVKNLVPYLGLQQSVDLVEILV